MSLFHHDRAIILSTGDEIITGQLQDTNARWLSEQLVARGVVPLAHAAVGDSLEELVRALRDAVDRAPLVIMSGGLGPTDGDLTRPALAAVLGDTLVLDAAAREQLAAMLARRGRELSLRQERQAYRPSRAACLANELGTAPGLHAVVPRNGSMSAADVVCLPGPPGELRPMFLRTAPSILRPPPGRAVATRLLHVLGIPEADCAARLGELTRRDRPDAEPLIGITASGGILTIRIRYAGPGSDHHAREQVDAAAASVRARLGPNCFGEGGAPGVEVLSAVLIQHLVTAGATLSVVESCTGGMLGETLTRIPGASAAFLGGFLTYANAAKESLGVHAESLKSFGAVSSIVAKEMAAAGRARSGSAFSLAITGIAGPDGGSNEKPVGTVHIALDASNPALRDARQFLFAGDREDIRRRSVTTALAMLYFALHTNAPAPGRLLWEVATNRDIEPTPAPLDSTPA